MFDLSRPMPDVFSVEVFSPSGDRHVDLANPRSPVILLDAGTSVNEGDELVIRGLSYRVIHIPWDWNTGRKPALALHRPRMQIIAERGEA